MEKRKDLVIFGRYSILAHNFIKNAEKNNYNYIFLTRKEIENQNDISLQLGKSLNKDEIDNICCRINELSSYDKKTFILFSWKGRPRSTQEEDKNWFVNENIINNFLRISEIIIPEKIIFISTAAVYSQNQNILLSENQKPFPESKYGKQKLIAEINLNKFAISKKIKITILRISSAYGFDKRFSEQGVVNKWLYCTLKNSEINLYNSLSSKINFISFEQISKAIIHTINKDILGTYNIGSIKSTSLLEILNKIESITEKKLRIRSINNSPRNINLDVRKFYNKTNITFENNLLENIYTIYMDVKKELIL